MDLVRNLILVFAIIMITLIALKVTDLLSSWYSNKAFPSLASTANSSSTVIGVNSYNASNYDLYGRLKPYLNPLDISITLAFLSALLGIFIYNRERT